MIDKIFKILLLLILGFIAYTFYLYTLNTRYSYIKSGVAFDHKTGLLYSAKPIKK